MVNLLKRLQPAALVLAISATAVAAETRSVAGWTVQVAPALLAADRRAATDRALELLQGQLEHIVRVVPAAAVAELRKVPLFFSPPYPGIAPKAEYHPGAGWLREHGRDPAMAKAVEFTNIAEFEAESRRMPCLALHELAHAWHDRVLAGTAAERDIAAAYQAAKAGGAYDRVERRDSEGRTSVGPAYALTNEREYFAEGTEAYFGRNDFQPYERADLERFDPALVKLLERVWAAVPGK